MPSRAAVRLCVAALLPALALAGAAEGELAGYRLGEAYVAGPATVIEPMKDGTVRITAEAPATGADVDAVYLYATAGTLTIGKILVTRWYDDLAAADAAAARQRTALEAAHPDWERLKAPLPMPGGQGAMVSRLQQDPHALIVFFQPADGRVEMVVELEYAPASAERKAWRQQTASERPAG